MEPSPTEASARERYASVFRYSRRAIELVWGTHRGLALALAILTVVAGIVPAGVAYVGKLIVDAVVAVAGKDPNATTVALTYVAWEAGLVALQVGANRGLNACQSLLRALLGNKVNRMVLEKAISLELPQFEDSEFYDKLTRARREASSRPLALVRKTFTLGQNLISLVTYGLLLWSFSPWAVLVLVVAGLPSFVAEAKFSNDAYLLFRWRSPESRKQMYLETVMAREDHAKEVKLFKLAPVLLQRYQDIFEVLYSEDKALTVRRTIWGYVLGLVGTAAFYGAYGWIVLATIRGELSLGEMTMYVLLFKQGQQAVSQSLTSVGGMYEDNLYLSTLYEFLEQEPVHVSGVATFGENPGDGIRFEDVSFTYPGSNRPALEGIDLHIRPGQKLALVGENGSGKTTLIKLLARLYEPSGGIIRLDGTPLPDWNPDTLRDKISVIFQDFVRYQLTVGENIGAGDVRNFEDRERWALAAEKGMATPFVEELGEGFDAQLGRWFRAGQELSGGQWQKIALSRVFMKDDAEILVLDEPTAAMDAEAEFRVFERIRELTESQMAILIAHRFSTVRMADSIVVLDSGKILERGTHEELLERDGTYARLFKLQASGYQ